jgi:hypothetical protein
MRTQAQFSEVSTKVGNDSGNSARDDRVIRMSVGSEVCYSRRSCEPCSLTLISLFRRSNSGTSGNANSASNDKAERPANQERVMCMSVRVTIGNANSASNDKTKRPANQEGLMCMSVRATIGNVKPASNDKTERPANQERLILMRMGVTVSCLSVRAVW